MPMNLADLRIFLSAARRPTLAEVAREMHLTPSAVSKALRRLEDSLGKPLFDRSARLLALNASGALLVPRAQALLALADQARADVQAEAAVIDCRIAGPAILLWRHGADWSHALRPYQEASLSLQAMFEDDALAALARSEVHAAVVTGEVLDGKGAHWSEAWVTVPLGMLAQHLVAGRRHPLAGALMASTEGSGDGGATPAVAALQASVAQVLEHEFACPTRSLFCGERRGARSDGWRDDQLPRKIRYWTDDLQLLLAFVQSGAALAYLPDFALLDPALVRIDVPDAAFTCHEQVALVYDGVQAPAWLRQLASQCGASPHA